MFSKKSKENVKRSVKGEFMHLQKKTEPRRKINIEAGIETEIVTEVDIRGQILSAKNYFI